MERRGKEPPKEWPRLPVLPEKPSYLWRWYREIVALGDTSPANIQAYFSMMGIQPEPWEFEAIKNLIGIGRTEGKKPC